MHSKSTMFSARRFQIRTIFRFAAAGLAVVVLLGAFALGAYQQMAWAEAMASDPYYTITAATSKATAISRCREHMMLGLRSPSEARFPALSSPALAVFGHEITVRDYVDAPNALGTPVRTEFTCVVVLSAERDGSMITDFDAYPR